MMGTLLLGFKPDVLTEAQVTRIRKSAPDTTVLLSHERDVVEQALDSIEIAVGSFPRDLFAKARNLRWYQQWSAGADWLMRHPEVADMDFVLTSASGVHSVPISEHIFALLLALARQLPQAFQAQTRQAWQSPSGVFELAGKTMLLIGVGEIGKRTALLAQAFGMHVLGVRHDPTKGVPGVDIMAGPAQLHDLLPKADVVVLTVPLTKATSGLIGEQEFSVMRKDAYLINIGRGGTIQEDALLRALQEGRIAGAGLDVFETEPLPEDSPLWQMNNVIITAHYSGSTPEYNERALTIFLDNLTRYQNGKPLFNVIDKQTGY